MSNSFRNASAARKLSRFLVSESGREYLAAGGPSGKSITLCHETEALSDVVDRARTYAPPVTLAVEYDDRDALEFVGLAISTATDEAALMGSVDPKATVGMILEYVNTCGGEFSFRLSEWSAPLEATQFHMA